MQAAMMMMMTMIFVITYFHNSDWNTCDRIMMITERRFGMYVTLLTLWSLCDPTWQIMLPYEVGRWRCGLLGWLEVQYAGCIEWFDLEILLVSQSLIAFTMYSERSLYFLLLPVPPHHHFTIASNATMSSMTLTGRQSKESHSLTLLPNIIPLSLYSLSHHLSLPLSHSLTHSLTHSPVSFSNVYLVHIRIARVDALQGAPVHQRRNPQRTVSTSHVR